MTKHILFIPLAALLGACGGTKASQTPVAVEPAPVQQAASRPAMARIKALVYKTNRPCIDNVAICLNENGDAVLSYPAPSDVSAASAPVQLPDGWLLDRRGLGPYPAFIDMTYSRYASLPQAPAPAELLEMVLPGVHVTEMLRLPMTPQEAAADTAAAMRAIHELIEE